MQPLSLTATRISQRRCTAITTCHLAQGSRIESHNATAQAGNCKESTRVCCGQSASGVAKTEDPDEDHEWMDAELEHGCARGVEYRGCGGGRWSSELVYWCITHSNRTLSQTETGVGGTTHTGGDGYDGLIEDVVTHLSDTQSQSGSLLEMYWMIIDGLICCHSVEQLTHSTLGFLWQVAQLEYNSIEGYGEGRTRDRRGSVIEIGVRCIKGGCDGGRRTRGIWDLGRCLRGNVNCTREDRVCDAQVSAGKHGLSIYFKRKIREFDVFKGVGISDWRSIMDS
ncbi:hypothetical protein Tco_1055761 [Tanacetum coccineum]|uniref:Uncharacterized protein n=1 Tax=Tanacetum coccineum TaxID=301880 RepID=A0ABQ5H1S8_9ASTR